MGIGVTDQSKASKFTIQNELAQVQIFAGPKSHSLNQICLTQESILFLIKPERHKIYGYCKRVLFNWKNIESPHKLIQMNNH